VKIQTILGDRLSDKKVVGAVPNLNSSPYILGNALYIRRKSTMSIVKERMREIIDSLPDDASYEEIMRELAFERMVERGLEDSRKGRIISNEEMEHRIKTWQR